MRDGRRDPLRQHQHDHLDHERGASSGIALRRARRHSRSRPATSIPPKATWDRRLRARRRADHADLALRHAQGVGLPVPVHRVDRVGALRARRRRQPRLRLSGARLLAGRRLVSRRRPPGLERVGDRAHRAELRAERPGSSRATTWWSTGGSARCCAPASGRSKPASRASPSGSSPTRKRPPPGRTATSAPGPRRARPRGRGWTLRLRAQWEFETVNAVQGNNLWFIVHHAF